VYLRTKRVNRNFPLVWHLDERLRALKSVFEIVLFFPNHAVFQCVAWVLKAKRVGKHTGGMNLAFVLLIKS
jgi:hypothetical protein